MQACALKSLHALLHLNHKRLSSERFFMHKEMLHVSLKETDIPMSFQHEIYLQAAGIT